VKWASLQFSNVNFQRDTVYPKLLKSVHFSPCYSKYKQGLFFETQCIAASATKNNVKLRTRSTYVDLIRK